MAALSSEEMQLHQSNLNSDVLIATDVFYGKVLIPHSMQWRLYD